VKTKISPFTNSTGCSQTMHEKTIRALVEAGAVKKVIMVADGATVHVDIVTQNGAVTATTFKGSIKTWTIYIRAKRAKSMMKLLIPDCSKLTKHMASIG